MARFKAVPGAGLGVVERLRVRGSAELARRRVRRIARGVARGRRVLLAHRSNLCDGGSGAVQARVQDLWAVQGSGSGRASPSVFHRAGVWFQFHPVSFYNPLIGIVSGGV